MSERTPDSDKRSGELWLPQSVIDQIKDAPPIPQDDEGRPTMLWGRPIKYVDDLPPVTEDPFGYYKDEEGKTP